MARYKPYNYKQKVMLPISLEEQLRPGSLEFAIYTLVEQKIDCSLFDEKLNNQKMGATAYDPRILLKIVLFAYSQGIFTSRKIEKACKVNVIFMALSCCCEPDHSTIATFISSMKEQITPLFCDILLVCEEMNLIGGTHFSIDGVKLPSNASKQLSGTFEKLTHKKDKIKQKVKQLTEQHISQDLSEKNSESEEEKRQKAIDSLKKKATTIEQFLEKNEPKVGSKNSKRKEKKSNVTDNDSAHMQSSHGYIQGYNSQAIADEKHQIIMYGEVIGESNDSSMLPPTIEGFKKNLKTIGYEENYLKGKPFSADSSYHSETNLEICKREELNAYIPDKDFRKRDSEFDEHFEKERKLKRKWFQKEDFVYDQEKDLFVCPDGKPLECTGKGWKVKEKRYDIYKAKKEDCGPCILKGKCLKQKNATRKQLSIQIEKIKETLSDKMKIKIDTEEGKKNYKKRFGLIEPVFGNIRVNKGLDRFTLRSKEKVNIQWLLFCVIHNIEKITNYGNLEERSVKRKKVS